MHAYACGLRSRAERVGEFLVGEIVREAQADRLELTGREVGERLVEPLEPGLVGPGRRGFAVESIEDAESCAGTPLEAAAADRRGEDMAGDGEQPSPPDPPAWSRKLVRDSHTCANVSAVRSCAAFASLDRPRWNR